MTANAQDYLKLIYQQGGLETIISNKTLAEQLGISAPSVTEMLIKLDKQGFIEYTPYKGSRLTPKGLESCIPLIRGHRLWEVFLIRHLGYSWSEAHEDAHLLEHTTPRRMLERLDRFLNYPEYCPHGSFIPKADGFYTSENLAALSLLEKGAQGTIRRVKEESDLLDYLQEAGIEINARFQIEEKGAYEGMIRLIIEDRIVEISHKAAKNVFVEQEE